MYRYRRESLNIESLQMLNNPESFLVIGKISYDCIWNLGLLARACEVNIAIIAMET